MSIVAPTRSQVEEWVRWSLELTHPNDPFDPSDGGTNSKRGQNGSVIFLAALAATEPPAGQASDRVDANNPRPLQAVLYHQDNGNATGQRPSVVPRVIKIESNDNRDILIPVLTEAACGVKYPRVTNPNALARAINDKERDNNGILSVLIEFNNQRYNGSALNNFLLDGNIQNVRIPPGNVFHQPSGDTTVAYNCCCAILRRPASGSSNSLRFSGGRTNYRYQVEYTINVM